MDPRMLRFVVHCALAALPLGATAQADFPVKPITMIVGYAAGGTTDVLARALAHEASKALGQQIIVVNRTGASGTIAAAAVASSEPDGYTIGLTPSTTFTAAHLFQGSRADLIESTRPLVTVGRMRVGLIVKADSPLRSLTDFIAEARRNPGKVSIGTPGAGTKLSLILRLVAAQDALDITLVPFQGDAPVATALLGGHVSAGAFSAASWGAHVRAGTMRVLSSMETERFDVAADAPTLAEQGYPYSSSAVVYAYGPHALPEQVARRLSDALANAARANT